MTKKDRQWIEYVSERQDFYILIEAEGKKMGMKSDVSKDEQLRIRCNIEFKGKNSKKWRTGSEEVLGYKAYI